GTRFAQPLCAVPAHSAVTIVLCTFNRAESLQGALERLLEQTPGSPPHEIIVDDNNSTDRTRGVAERFRARARPMQMQYVFEPRQGLSYARNAGIAASGAPIVAFTDDDVRVSANWVTVIHRTFAAHPEITCLGGRTLPVWPMTPPSWLTPQH